MTKTIEHDPHERQRHDWRAYRRKVLAEIHANHAQFEAQPDVDGAKMATLRLAQALQPAFVVWCAAEFGQHETDGQKAFLAFTRAMPWLFLHLAELIQGTRGPYVMVDALASATITELANSIRAEREAKEDGNTENVAPPTAGTA